MKESNQIKGKRDSFETKDPADTNILIFEELGFSKFVERISHIPDGIIK